MSKGIPVGFSGEILEGIPRRDIPSGILERNREGVFEGIFEGTLKKRVKLCSYKNSSVVNL